MVGGNALKIAVVHACILVVLVACKRQSGAEPEGFIVDTMLPTTPVKNQEGSELCWMYAMFATIEAEHLMQGDSVNLSVDYSARLYLRRLAIDYFRSGGRSRLVRVTAEAGVRRRQCGRDKTKSNLSLRGVGPMAVALLRTDGCVPQESYFRDTPVNWNVVVRKVERLAQSALRHHLTEEWFARSLDSLLDKEIGVLPQAVYMFGAKYTPAEFAHSICRADEYVALMADDRMPVGSVLRLPFDDNCMGAEGMNVPRDSLVSYVKESIRAGHPVFWEGGENDNHALALVGMGRAADGKLYFIGKNSWGEDSGNHGFVYISERYLLNKTAVVVIIAKLLPLTE